MTIEVDDDDKWWLAIAVYASVPYPNNLLIN